MRIVKASPVPSGIERHRPAKQNQSSPALVNFHFDFGGLVPVNSKKCEAGIRQRPFFLFDLLYLDGETLGAAPLGDRKERLRGLSR